MNATLPEIDPNGQPLPEALTDANWTGPCCEKCGAPQRDPGMTACTACGWYASLGIYVEVSREWESAMGGGPAAAPPARASVGSVLGSIPGWAWGLLATQAVVVACCVALRLATSPESDLRSAWGVGLLLGGLVLAMLCHFAAFVLVAADDPDMSVLDLVVSPLKSWIKLCHGLPRRHWLLNACVSSLVTAVCAAGIVGGIPYERLWDWGIQAPTKKNLVAAIAQKGAGNKNEKQSMEEAMKSFADDAAVDGYGPDGQLKPVPKSAEIARKSIDGLIVGFTIGGKGRIDELIVVTEHNKRLLYAGRVRPTLPPAELDALQLKLQANLAPRPFVTVLGDANWVHPKFPCRLTYDRRVESGMLQGLLWDRPLAEIKMPW
ncbi:hypothetical protein Pla175_35510 [Pirellulimonas nuda]|uniref:DNA ligase (ATP) n=1 Tax=Pirellulimonas nuda TaxID=2528009 RepID=A0A518DFA7_9BACT|nr:hypothetical protein [Pirellulimonas nuda]QDU90150.1 hypothetical protein Pla175_35510 [Pirellulimonas nuda]